MISSGLRRALPALVAVAAIAGLAGCAPDQADPPPPPPTSAQPVTTPLPASVATEQPHAKTRIVTIGDSLMSGYGLPRTDAWPLLLGSAEHVSVVNLACGGMGFIAVGDCGTPYSGLVPAVIALVPDIVVIEASSNDFDLSPDDLDQATMDTLQQLRAALPDTPIVCLSTIWNDDEDVPDDVAVTSDALAAAAAATGCIYIDVGQPLSGHPEWMQGDDVHPDVAGQRALAKSLAASMAAAGALPSVAG